MTPFAFRSSLAALPIAAATWMVVSARVPRGDEPVGTEDTWPAEIELLDEAPEAVTETDAHRELRENRLTEFRSLLTAFRKNELEDTGDLETLAQDLSEEHGRGDMAEVLRYFMAIDGEARARGYADFLHSYSFFNDIYGEEPDHAAIETEVQAFIDDTRTRRDGSATAAGLYTLAACRFERLFSVEGTLDEELAQGVREAATESLQLYQETGQLQPQILPYIILGDLEKGIGNLQEARRHYERCRSVSHRVGRTEYRQYAVIELMRMGHDIGDMALVEFGLRDWASFSNPEESWMLAHDYATLLLHADRAEAARKFLARHPVPVGEDGSSNPDEVAAHAVLEAAILRRLGHLPEAHTALASLDEGMLDESFRKLAEADLALAGGDGARVIELLSEVTESFEPKERALAYQRLGLAWDLEGDKQRARRWLRSALDLADDWQVRTGDALSGSVKGEWIGLHTVVRLAEIETALGDPLEAARLLEDHQSSRLRSVLDGAPGISLTDLEAWAQEYELGLITWAIGPDESVVAYVDRELEAWSTTIPHGRRAFLAAASRLVQATLEGDEERAELLAEEISLALVPEDCPLRHKRPASADERLLALVHGPIENLPLARLSLYGQPIDESLTLVVLPGLPGSTPEPAPDSYSRRIDGPIWTLLGGPTDGNGRKLLPKADSEIRDLERSYPRATVRLGEAFDEDAVRTALAGSGPVHIATHLVESSICESSRLDSVGLLLSGGRVFCAQEILELRPRLPLVLLTTCDSGVGRFIDAEGLHGMGRAFLEGGTRNLLATLWPVGDEAAHTYALQLHEHLLRGASPSRAARLSRAALRAAGHPPMDWSAFRFLGRD